MGKRILLYGATGYSGALIAEQAANLQRQGRWPHTLLLAGRNTDELARLAGRTGFATRAFGLDDPQVLARNLVDVDLVINAAGPFAYTAMAMARACILQGCHCVDICGELDVHRALDDLGRSARPRGVVLVSGAGHTAALADALLCSALRRLARDGQRPLLLGPVQLVYSAASELSRGSMKVMLRQMREQVLTVQREVDDTAPAASEAGSPAAESRALRIRHLPQGRLEQTFDFRRDSAGGAAADLRIASAANLVDTLVALRSCQRAQVQPRSIASYIAMDTRTRLACQLGAWAAPVAGTALARRWLQPALDWLPQGPDASERSGLRNQVLLRVHSRHDQPLIDWCLDTPDVYEVTARCALDVAQAVLALPVPRALAGWRTPGELLAPKPETKTAPDSPWKLRLAFEGCRLTDRLAQQPERKRA